MRANLNIKCIFLLVLFFSCSREEMPDDDHFNAADNFNRTIKINTYHVFDVWNGLDSTLPDVTVEIYSSRENFADVINPDATRITDSAGYAIFEARDKDYYWIRAQHDSLGIVLDSAGTPENTISFIPIFFY
ncbi:MAG: hypothetical protein H7X71_02230 [Chitinophagales bacterium]|nr:hypothetical protein [Chitinophagales bacterium]